MRRARLRAAALVAALAVAAVVPSSAQERPPDVPAGDATLEGRVVDESGGGVADVGVILYSLRPDGEPGLRQTRSDEAGGFRFESVSGDPEVVYLVGTRVGGVPFGARVAFEAGEVLRRVEVEVTQPTRDVSQLRADEVGLRLERGCTHLRVHHQHTLENGSSQVVFVPPDARDDADPIFEVLLPEPATAIETPLGTDAEGFERDGRSVRFYGPVYPGASSVEFSYGLPLADAADLSVGFPNGVAEARVLTPSRGLRVEAPGFRRDGETPVPLGAPLGPHLQLRSARPIAPGKTLELALLYDAPGTAALSLSEGRLWLELDDALLDVSELYQLRVEGDQPVQASGSPLLCIPMPPGAEGLRFSNASLEMGLSRDPEGAVAVAGPIPVGESALSLRYRLPASTPDGEPLVFQREFRSPVDLLTVLIADTGIVPETERLHRRRPIRTEDRSYLHLEGFGIESGDRVAIALRRLPPGGSLPGLATTGFVLLAAIGSLFYLVAPLRERSEPAAAQEASGISPEREAIYAAIDDLDDDFETGKLSVEDHERMRAELRARAVAVLQAERDAEGRRGSAAASDRGDARCPRCDAIPSTQDRFCSQCGAPLRPGDSPAS